MQVSSTRLASIHMSVTKEDNDVKSMSAAISNVNIIEPSGLNHWQIYVSSTKEENDVIADIEISCT
jgi:hypothetical protein